MNTKGALSTLSFRPAGYIANCGVVGCLAYWAPKAGAQAFDMDNADLLFGGVTVATGLLGTFFGGVALDFVGSTMSNAFLVRKHCKRFPDAALSNAFIGRKHCLLRKEEAVTWQTLQ
jgi:hypothetical protein